MTLRTPRLTLVPATAEHLHAELHAPQRLAGMLGAVVSPAWPTDEYDRGALEFFHARMVEGGASVEGWYVWYALRHPDADGPCELVAAGGYVGPPSAEGVVEIGYSVLERWRRRGYASDMVAALVARAFEHDGVTRVIAHTHDTNAGSVAVLERHGFVRTGPGEDPTTVRFERAR